MQADPNWDTFAPFDDDGSGKDERLKEMIKFLRSHREKIQDADAAAQEPLGADGFPETGLVAIHLHPPDSVAVPDLIKTQNELLDKVLTVFAVLCDEVDLLRRTAEENFFPALTMIGHGVPGGEDPVGKDGDEELLVGKTLPFLQETANLCERLSAITVNIVHQLASLYHGRQQLYQTTFKHVQLLPVFEALADVMCVLITFDRVVADNEPLELAWRRYKRLIQNARADPDAYALDMGRKASFERMLVALDAGLLGGGCFQQCIDQDFEVPGPEEASRPMVEVRNNHVFLGELRAAVVALHRDAAARIGGPSELGERRRLVGVVGLYALYRRLVPPREEPDEKLYRQLWESQRAAPLVTLYGRSSASVGELLAQHAPLPVRKLSPRDIPTFLRESARNAADSFAARTNHRYGQVCAWLVRMEARFGDGAPVAAGTGSQTADRIRRLAQLLEAGVLLAHGIGEMVGEFVNLHSASGFPLQKRSVPDICRCCEMLKAVEAAFSRKRARIAAAFPSMLRNFAVQLGTVFRPLKRRLEASKRVDDAKLDTLGAISLLERVAFGSEGMAPPRRLVLALALSVVTLKGVVKDGEHEIAASALWHLGALGELTYALRRAADCSFLFWHLELLAPMLEHIYAHPEQGKRLRLLVSALLDARTLLARARHVDDTARLEAEFDGAVTRMLTSRIVDPLCKDVDADLRLRVHSVYNRHLPPAPNPRQRPELRMAAWGCFLRLPRLRLLRGSLDIRARVEHALSRTFYNLTTMALHDWQMYSEMRNLARERYGLALHDAYLPVGSLETGLDVLQIMRNIHVFVARYAYNLHQQFFIERRLDKGEKMLHAIGIDSITASIRTHGAGIMNTTVNFTYQFLTRKFFVFSQFLYDEYIKSYLSRERRWFRKHRDEVDNTYPYDHARKFAKEIRKLGVSKDGKSFLDKFRELVTEIGNALGYVRMVRAAGMSYSSAAIKFVPELDAIVSFEQCAGDGPVTQLGNSLNKRQGEGENAGEPGEKKAPQAGAGAGDGDGESGAAGADASVTVRSGAAGDVLDEGEEEIPGAKLSPPTVRAAANLDRVLEQLSNNFAEGVDYLQVLVEVFREVLHGQGEHAHLKNFFMIVPALCLNFCESSRIAKDRLEKLAKGGEAYFTNDGFAMGVAYILAILRQHRQFESLHWWDSNRNELRKDQGKLDETRAALRKRDANAAEDLQFQQGRLSAAQREVELLFWSYDGARIFFRDEEEEGGPAGKKKGKAGAPGAPATDGTAGAAGDAPAPTA